LPGDASDAKGAEEMELGAALDITLKPIPEWLLFHVDRQLDRVSRAGSQD